MSLFLLGVIVPFWIGFEFTHHAEFFGHHSGEASAQAQASSCCCCSPASTAPTQDTDDASVSDYHNCQICEFFDQLNVHSDAPIQGSQGELQSGTVDQLLIARTQRSISATARGPPVA